MEIAAYSNERDNTLDIRATVAASCGLRSSHARARETDGDDGFFSLPGSAS
jgi:hypothetical protein